MKFINKLTAGLVGVSLLSTALAETPKPAPASAPIKFELPKTGTAPAQPAAPAAAPVAAPAAPVAAPAAPAIKYSQAQLMEAYGILLAARSNLVELEFAGADIDAMAKGMKMLLSGEKPSYANDSQNVNQQLMELISQKQKNLFDRIKAQNVATSAAYFAKAKANKAIQFQPSGLGLETLKPGTGASVKVGQVAKFHFTLSSVTDEVLSSSVGQQPLEAVVREGEMFAGMIEGLQKIPVGGKAKLYIPYQLAAGEDGAQGMPPATSLVFEIEMLEVKDAPKEAAPAK